MIIGGVEQQQQAQALARRPHVVVATPGRLAALVQSDSSLGAGERSRQGVAENVRQILAEQQQQMQHAHCTPATTLLMLTNKV